jgi:hypothetical protein
MGSKRFFGILTSALLFSCLSAQPPEITDKKEEAILAESDKIVEEAPKEEKKEAKAEEKVEEKVVAEEPVPVIE